MAFGINNLINYMSIINVGRIYKRNRDLKKFKNSNLKLPLNYNILNSKFGKNNCVFKNVTFIHSSIDNYTYINHDTKIKYTDIGKFCSIGPNVQINLGKHPINFVSTHPSFYANNKRFITFSDDLYIEEYGKVTIGNDVWIGEGVVIPSSVKVGDGAIISTRAVVTKDVEPYSIVGGIPAKHIKYRFDKKIIDKLIQIKWWNWEESMFKKHFKLFHDPKKIIEYASLHKKNINNQ